MKVYIHLVFIPLPRFPLLMDLAHVRRSVAANSIIIEELCSGRGDTSLDLYSSSLILIEGTTAHSSRALLNCFSRTQHHVTSIDAAKLILSEEAHPEAAREAESGKFIIIRDLTIELLDEKQVPATYYRALVQMAHQAGRRGATLIVEIQRDILPLLTVTSLEYLADTTVHILNNNGASGSLLSIVHRMPGGRLKRETVRLLSDGKFERVSGSSVQGVDSPPSAPINRQQLPVSTFNLSLSEEQARAKAAIVLPHLRAQIASMTILAEDYDEEDPDEDLDV